MVSTLIKNVLLASVLLFLFFQYDVAAENDLLEIDDSNFMNITNFAPGLSHISDATVTNKSEHSLTYEITLDYQHGSRSFLEELQVIMRTEGETRYAGSLAELKDISMGELPRGEKVEVEFEVQFPKELGNEFQGKKTAVVLNVFAKQKGETRGESDPPIDEEDRDQKSGSVVPPKRGGDGGLPTILPQTGEEGKLAFYLIGILAMLSGVYLYMKAIKKRRSFLLFLRHEKTRG